MADVTKATTLWSLSAVKHAVGMTDQADQTQDRGLIEIANGVSQMIERVTKRRYVTREYTEVRDGDGSRVLMLDNFPVVALTSIAILRSPTDASPETVTASYYVVNLKTGKIHFHSDKLSKGVGNVTVVYTAGYGVQDADTLPADIYSVGLDIVKLMWNERTQGVVGASSVSIGNHSYIIKPEWPKQIKQVLDSWARVM